MARNRDSADFCDLGSNSVNYPTTGNWNNISAPNNANVSEYSVTNIIDTDGQSSSINVNIGSGFTCVMDAAYTTTVNNEFISLECTKR